VNKEVQAFANPVGSAPRIALGTGNDFNRGVRDFLNTFVEPCCLVRLCPCEIAQQLRL